MTAISPRPGSTRNVGEMKGIKSKVNKLGKWWKSLDKGVILIQVEKPIVFILIPEKHPSLDTTRDDANGSSDANQFMSVHHDFRV